MLDILMLEPRREPKRSGRVRRGAHKPLAIRWFGMTALAGHLRHLLAVAAASNQLDLRDWMRPEDPARLLNRVCQVLGASASGGSLIERLGREVWIDFVADTGDDHDVSLAVGRMLFSEYAISGDQSRRLPRGDILVFGGDVAYPASTAYEIERRLLRPWNQVLHGKAEDGRRRVVLGIPGNHDWYDGLDGFGRLFRRSALEDSAGQTTKRERDRPRHPAIRSPSAPKGLSSAYCTSMSSTSLCTWLRRRPSPWPPSCSAPHCGGRVGWLSRG